jgi:hypothetical protein
MSTLAQMAIAILSVSVTVIAVIPALVELVRTRSPGFMAGALERQRLWQAVAVLQIATGLSSGAVFAWGIALRLPSIALMWVTVALVLIATICITVAALASGAAVHRSMKE